MSSIDDTSEICGQKRQKVLGRTKTAPIPSVHTENQSFGEMSVSGDGKIQRSDDLNSFREISNSERLNSACSLTRVTTTSTHSSSSHSSSTYHEESNSLIQDDKSQDSTENRKSLELNSGCSDMVSDIQSTFDRLLNSPTCLNPLSGPDNIPYADESPEKPHGSPSRLRDPSWHRRFRSSSHGQHNQQPLNTSLIYDQEHIDHPNQNKIHDRDIVDYASTSSTISSQQSCHSVSTQSCESNDTMDSLRSDQSDLKENDDHQNLHDVSSQSISGSESATSTNKSKDYKNVYTGNFLLKSQSNSMIPVNVVKPLNTNNTTSDANTLSYNVSKQSTVQENISNQDRPTEGPESNINLNITSNQAGTSLTLTSEGLYNDKSTTVSVKPGSLFRSESLNKHDRTQSPINKLKRSESLNKKDDIKLKRSESLSKSEKTQTNYKTREMTLSSKNCGKKDTKLKRKNGSQNRSINVDILLEELRTM
ncbi:uncharacterized protein DDB_G0281025-like [Ctenocephalides felis]|uniref:uncharacterized protein DDB_G0281025-like n=1 Tax=Ctenocephalides felis TaxID=7515 RepID=UPI000E6E44AC|nr:uncharacterized protein DDB_G0281025-like [Ctenocephalides felis]